jgi:hypothetical protein
LKSNQEVCAANAVIRYFGRKACVSPCTFLPEVEPEMTVCAIEDGVDLATVKSGMAMAIAHGDLGKFYTW